jgi:hypothetical protein
MIFPSVKTAAGSLRAREEIGGCRTPLHERIYSSYGSAQLVAFAHFVEVRLPLKLRRMERAHCAFGSFAAFKNLPRKHQRHECEKDDAVAQCVRGAPPEEGVE